MALSVITGSVFAPILDAQQPSATLTLDDAISLALRHNPQYRQAINRLDGASAQVRSGFGRFLPTLNLGANYGGSASTVVTGQDDAGRPIELPQPLDFRSSSASQSLSASWTLFDGFGNTNNFGAARASERSAERSAEAAGWAVEAETIRRFYAVLQSERRLELEVQLLVEREDRLNRTERLFRVSTTQTQEDVLGARADVATQQVNVDVARGNLAKAKLALVEQMGIEDQFEFEVAGELPQQFDPLQYDADSLVLTALGANPEVLGLEAAEDAARMRASSTRGSRWPSVRFNAGYTRSESLRSYAALTEFNPQNTALSFGVGVSWPLFTGFQTSAQVASADVDSRNSYESLRQGRLRVERAVRSALIDVQNAFRSLESARISAQLNRERVQLAEQRYAIGAVQFATLQQYVGQSAQADRVLVDAEFGFASAVVSLDEAVGQRVRP